MYNVSPDFSPAVAAGNDQKALLAFSDALFTDEDIVIDRGIEFNDRFNVETDLCIGQAISNECSFSLVNKNRLLNNYGFGDFLATLGVQIDSGTYTKETNETVRIVSGGTNFVGYSVSPYVKRNGTAVASQTGFAVRSMIAWNGRVYCFGQIGQYKCYDMYSGNDVSGTYPANDFMRDKGVRLAGQGMIYDDTTRTLFIYEDGKYRKYEFCPMGYYTADRPNAPDVIQIDMVCYDWMQKFEKDISDFNISYPITISQLYEVIASTVLGSTGYLVPTDFINGGAIIDKEPADFESATARDVLKWIAEASATNAKFNRDGKLTLSWIGDSAATTIGPNAYSEFNPYWYEVPKITKLVNRSTQEGDDYTVGNGTNIYLIQDNPLLRGVS